jgi:hypothetical protein
VVVCDKIDQDANMTLARYGHTLVTSAHAEIVNGAKPALKPYSMEALEKNRVEWFLAAWRQQGKRRPFGHWLLRH